MEFLHNDKETFLLPRPHFKLCSFYLGVASASLPHLAIISFLVYYTFYRGRLANCGGLPPISLRRRLSVTKYEKAMLITALIALVIDALTFLLK